MSDPYESEILNPLVEDERTELHAYFTARSGIRIDIWDKDINEDCMACFQLTADQADQLAAFLKRSAEKYRRWDGQK